MTDGDRLAELKRKLAASGRMGAGFKDRITELKRQIAALEGGDQVVADEGND